MVLRQLRAAAMNVRRELPAHHRISVPGIGNHALRERRRFS